MAKRVQLRRGTTAQTNAFTGAAGEVTIDTDKKVPVVHDGITVGGFPQAARANADGTISLIKKDGTIVGSINSSGLFNNTLTSTNTDQALTAAQGKVLNDALGGLLLSNGGASNLKIVTVGVNNYSSVITAKSAVMQNTTGQSYFASSISVTGSINTSGVNGLDTGSLAANTWYYLFLIYNPTTSTVASLYSLSATAPTLPIGYTAFVKIGEVRTWSTPYLLCTLKVGNKTQYVVTTGSNTPNLPIMTQGAIGTWSNTAPIYASVSTSNFIPPTAVEIKLKVSKTLNGAGTYMGIAPNAGYSGVITSNPPVYSADNIALCDNSGLSLLLESSNIYAYTSGAGGLIQCLGWEDKV